MVLFSVKQSIINIGKDGYAMKTWKIVESELAKNERRPHIIFDIIQ